MSMDDDTGLSIALAGARSVTPGETELSIALAGARSVTPGEAPVYDPQKSQDKARAGITYWLLALLTLLFISSFLAVFNAMKEQPTFEQLKTLIEILLGPLVALVSAATGFYFGAGGKGAQSQPQSQTSAPPPPPF